MPGVHKLSEKMTQPPRMEVESTEKTRLSTSRQSENDASEHIDNRTGISISKPMQEHPLPRRKPLLTEYSFIIGEQISIVSHENEKWSIKHIPNVLPMDIEYRQKKRSILSYREAGT
jgi:hypothetical protein